MHNGHVDGRLWFVAAAGSCSPLICRRMQILLSPNVLYANVPAAAVAVVAAAAVVASTASTVSTAVGICVRR
ncbi:hypothetical protein PV325_010589 [Microctonus aethiopoides]|nr:hypothetical protein PV325_010589 [Microctonus aethiopoides]